MLKWMWVWILLVCSTAQGQDTLRVMHYNLLNYGSTTGFCLIECKEDAYRTVIDRIDPMLITVNEMAPGALLAQRFLNNVLNINDVDYWQRGDYLNTNGQNLVNNVYYDSRHLTLTGSWHTPTAYRDIRTFEFAYVPVAGDSVHFQITVAHLKAGSSGSDVSTRAAETAAFMEDLAVEGPFENRLFSGDVNAQGADEPAMTNLLTGNLSYGDPFAADGTWGIFAYSHLHTQSTRTEPLGDDGAPGGLDDRFDVTFMSPAVSNGSHGMVYLAGSYRIPGNDGNLYNNSILGSSLDDEEFIEALYRASDHLPVVTEYLNQSPLSSSRQNARVQTPRIN